MINFLVNELDVDVTVVTDLQLWSHIVVRNALSHRGIVQVVFVVHLTRVGYIVFLTNDNLVAYRCVI